MLNLAWDEGARLLKDLDSSGYYGVDREEVAPGYWDAARQQLATALTLAHQGAEFLLKSRIVAVSPYLLIAGQARDWPKRCAQGDTPFAEFRTLAAQDLVKVHDTVCKSPLDPKVVEELDSIRRKRNLITHTFDQRIRIEINDLLVSVLTIHSALCPEEGWVSVRAQHLSSSPISELHSADHVNGETVWEFALVVDTLDASNLVRFFGFDKTKNRYICRGCQTAAQDNDATPLSSTFLEDQAEPPEVWCFVCGERERVARKLCGKDSCSGDIQAIEDGICLSCGAS